MDEGVIIAISATVTVHCKQDADVVETAERLMSSVNLVASDDAVEDETFLSDSGVRVINSWRHKLTRLVFSHQTRKRALDADGEDISSNKRSNIDLSPGQKGVSSPDGEEQQDRCSNTTELTGTVSMSSTVTSRSHSRDST